MVKLKTSKKSLKDEFLSFILFAAVLTFAFLAFSYLTGSCPPSFHGLQRMILLKPM